MLLKLTPTLKLTPCIGIDTQFIKIDTVDIEIDIQLILIFKSTQKLLKLTHELLKLTHIENDTQIIKIDTQEVPVPQFCRPPPQIFTLSQTPLVPTTLPLSVPPPHPPQGPLHSPLDSARGTRHHGLVERVQRDPRRMISPLRRYVRQISFSFSLLATQRNSSRRESPLVRWGSL